MLLSKTGLNQGYFHIENGKNHVPYDIYEYHLIKLSELKV